MTLTGAVKSFLYQREFGSSNLLYREFRKWGIDAMGSRDRRRTKKKTKVGHGWGEEIKFLISKWGSTEALKSSWKFYPYLFMFCVKIRMLPCIWLLGGVLLVLPGPAAPKGFMWWTESLGGGRLGQDSVSRNFTNSSEKDYKKLLVIIFHWCSGEKH